MNIIKRMWATAPVAHDAVTISPGELFLNRNDNSPKGGRSSLFSGSLTVSTPSDNYTSQLVVTPLDEDTDSSDADSLAEIGRLESEKSFLVDAALKIAYTDVHGATVVSWVDPEGDEGDRYEFVCGPEVSRETYIKFDNLCRTIQFGRMYGREPTSEKDLEQFDFDTAAVPLPPQDISSIKGMSLYEAVGELCVYDMKSRLFLSQLNNTPVHLVEVAKFEYTLTVGSLAVPVSANMSAVANNEHKALIFNVYMDEKLVTYMIRFPSLDAMTAFNTQFCILLWQASNKMDWTKVPPADQEFIQDAFGPEEDSAEMKPVQEEDLGEDDQEDDEGSYDEEDGNYSGLMDDDDVEYKGWKSSNSKNSRMEVGTNKDRTYVVRGNDIGVFKSTNDDMEFCTTIRNVMDTNKELLLPEKILLHEQDRALVVQGADKNQLYRLDLETGKVVEEWTMANDVTSYAPVSKFAQSTIENNLVATGTKSVYRIDPRLAGSKVVQDASKTYSSISGLNSIATTESGHVAVGSKDGDIRLYDKLGKIAKTHLPAIGDQILGLDVTSDGQWVLATFKTYLLLMETTTNEFNGFTKSIPKGSRIKPKRLQLTAETASFLYEATGEFVSFTPAKFDMSQGSKERSIVTSTGPYVITWSLTSILRNEAMPYRIKSYSTNVSADNFQYGGDKRVVVALQNDVGIVKKTALRRPTRGSLAPSSF